jgi:hypothetical protein
MWSQMTTWREYQILDYFQVRIEYVSWYYSVLEFINHSTANSDPILQNSFLVAVHKLWDNTVLEMHYFIIKDLKTFAKERRYSVRRVIGSL